MNGVDVVQGGSSDAGFPDTMGENLIAGSVMASIQPDQHEPALEPDMLELLTVRSGAAPALSDIEVLDRAIGEITAYRNEVAALRSELLDSVEDNRTRKAAGEDVSAQGAIDRLTSPVDDHAVVKHTA